MFGVLLLKKNLILKLALKKTFGLIQLHQIWEKLSINRVEGIVLFIYLLKLELLTCMGANKS